MVSTVECWSQRIESMTLRTDQWNLSSVNNGGTIIILKKLTESQKLWDNNQKNQSSYHQIPSIKGERVFKHLTVENLTLFGEKEMYILKTLSESK